MTDQEKKETIAALQATTMHSRKLMAWLQSWAGEPRCGLQKQWDEISRDVARAESIIEKMKEGK